MRIITLAATAIIVLLTTIGSASAADELATLDGSALLQSSATGQFAVLDGIPAEAMSAGAKSRIRGSQIAPGLPSADGFNGAAGNARQHFNMAVAGPIWLGKVSGNF